MWLRTKPLAPHEQSHPPAAPSSHFHDNARQRFHIRHAAFHPFPSSGLMPSAWSEGMARNDNTSRKPAARILPPIDQISEDTPLRLNVAAALAYPDGSMTASGLRREAAKGRLVIERTAGKDYTTLG